MKGKLAVFTGLFVGLTVFCGVAGGQSEREDRERAPRGPKGEFRERDRERGGRGDWERLPEEKRERIRAALKAVFESEEVGAARQRMREASDAYKKALREAIGRVDSEIKGDLERMLRSRLDHSDFGGRPGRFRGMPVPMERIPEGKRARMGELLKTFSEREDVKALRRSLAEDGLKGEEHARLRNREYGMFRKFVGEKAPELIGFLPPRPPFGAGGPGGPRDGEAGGRRRGGGEAGGGRARGREQDEAPEGDQETE